MPDVAFTENRGCRPSDACLCTMLLNGAVAGVILGLFLASTFITRPLYPM